MSTEIVERNTEKPAVREDWNYTKSVSMVQPILSRWKSEARELIIPELWNAYEHLSKRDILKSPSDVKAFTSDGQIRTFQSYCEAIGITRQTGRNWLIQANLLLNGAHVSNNTGNQENYTPVTVIEAVRDVMGEIDLDPASCEFANEVVRAKAIYTEEDNALEQPWSGRVFLNPPYQQPEIRLFAEKLISELPNIEEAIVLVNNNTDTKWFLTLALGCAAVCFTTGRIGFYTPDIEKTAPTNGQAFFYFGQKLEVFKKRFRDVGIVMQVAK